MLNTMQTSIDLAIDSIALCIALLLVGVMIKNLWQYQIFVEPIFVPPEVSNRGYSGEVLARSIKEQLIKIALEVARIEFAPGARVWPKEKSRGVSVTYATPAPATMIMVSTHTDSASLDVTVPGLGISLRWLLNYLKQTLHMPGVTVSGYVIKDNHTLTLRLQIVDMRRPSDPKFTTICDLNLDSSAAEEWIMGMVQPHILACYYNKRGAESLADGKPDKAASFFKRSIAVSPEKPDLFDRSEVYTNLGWALVEQGCSGEAEQKFRTALAINNDSRKQGGDAAANRDRSAYTYVTWGRMLSRQNNHDGAIGKFQEAIRANREYVYAYVSWANALREKRERKADEEAIEKCKKALDCDPLYDYAHVVWGEILLSNALASADGEVKKKKLEEAADQFREAIKVNRDYALGYMSLGRVLELQGKIDEALAKCQKAAELDPDYGRAYVFWGDVLDRKGDYRGAAAKFQKATEVTPNDDFAYVRWGEILAKQSDYDGAIAKFEEALEVHPDYDFAYLAWGRVLLDNQKAPATAIEKFKKVIERKQHAEAYSDWGRALAVLGDHKGATAMFRKAHKINPSFPPE